MSRHPRPRFLGRPPIPKLPPVLRARGSRRPVVECRRGARTDFRAVLHDQGIGAQARSHVGASNRPRNRGDHPLLKRVRARGPIYSFTPCLRVPGRASAASKPSAAFPACRSRRRRNGAGRGRRRELTNHRVASLLRGTMDACARSGGRERRWRSYGTSERRVDAVLLDLTLPGHFGMASWSRRPVASATT